MAIRNIAGRSEILATNTGLMVVDVNQQADRATYFQSVVERMLTYWCDHDAIKMMDVTVLDRERNRILKNITLGLDLQPLWPLVQKMIIAFAPYMERRGLWDIWHRVLEQAIRVAQRAGDAKAESILTASLARLCQFMSRAGDVVRYYRQAIRLARRSGNHLEEARACSNLGYVYIDGGHWWRSDVLNRHALAIFEALDNEPGLAQVYNHLGLLHMRNLAYDTAEEYLLKSCAILSSLNDEYGLLRGYTILGLTLTDQARSSEALTYLHKSLALAEKLGDLFAIGTTQMNIGYTYIKMQQYQKADELLFRAKKQFAKSGNSLALARSLQDLGISQMHQGKWNDADQYMNEALNLARAMGLAEEEIRIRLNLLELATEQQSHRQFDAQWEPLKSLISAFADGDVRRRYQDLAADLHKRMRVE